MYPYIIKFDDETSNTFRVIGKVPIRNGAGSDDGRNGNATLGDNRKLAVVAYFHNKLLLAMLHIQHVLHCNSTENYRCVLRVRKPIGQIQGYRRPITANIPAKVRCSQSAKNRPVNGLGSLIY
jgi:hypothetical protein